MSEERIEHQAGDDDAQAVDTFPDVMTVKQLAAYLQVGERSVYNLAKAGDLPGVFIANQWRFYRPEIERWLAMQSRQSVGDPTPVEPPKVNQNGKV